MEKHQSTVFHLRPQICCFKILLEILRGSIILTAILCLWLYYGDQIKIYPYDDYYKELEDHKNVTSDNKSCYRPCKFNVKPRQCRFRFNVEPSFHADGRPAITINGKSPGPPINVCQNDFIIVEVKNKIPDQDLAIHWDGIEQKGTPHMDGVPMVTQCPISYGSTYKYAFIASSPGTFFYHADSALHQSDGVYGALVVNQPQAFEPHFSLYDYDRSQEHTVIVAAKFPKLMTANLEDMNSIQPNGLVIHEEENFKMPGFSYRLRLINAIAIECPITMSIDRHEMTIIASDGRPVKPMSADYVLLYPGERMDVVVRPTEEMGGYWLRVRGIGVCAGLQANSMFLYTGVNYTTSMDVKAEANDSETSPKTVFGQMLQSYHDVIRDSGVKSYYLGIDERIVEFNEKDIDFRYISDALPVRPFFPASLSIRDTGVVQLNSKNFLYPNRPLLLNPIDPRVPTCPVGEENTVSEPQCLQILNAKKGDVVELALVNEGVGSTDSYTFHMHGYGMQVVATSRSDGGHALSRGKFLAQDKAGKIMRNLKNPPIKDTITVPNKGYTIVRIPLHHGGSWLLECRSCGLFSLPTAIVIQVPQIIPKKVSDALPKCGSYKPPDVLLN